MIFYSFALFLVEIFQKKAYFENLITEEISLEWLWGLWSKQTTLKKDTAGSDTHKDQTNFPEIKFISQLWTKYYIISKSAERVNNVVE